MANALEAALIAKAMIAPGGMIKPEMIPGGIDEIKEFASKSAFPSTGAAGVIYYAKDTKFSYRWGGTDYVLINTIELGENANEAYYGDKGKEAYDHSQTEGNPHNTTAEDIGALTGLDLVGAKAAINNGIAYIPKAAPTKYGLVQISDWPGEDEHIAASVKALKRTDDKAEENIKSINDINESIHEVVRKNYCSIANTFIDGTRLATTGNYTYNNRYTGDTRPHRVSNLMSCNPGDTFTISTATGASGVVNLVFYKDNGETRLGDFVSVTNPGAALTATRTAPAETTHFAFGYPTTLDNNIKVEKGNSKTDYYLTVDDRISFIPTVSIANASQVDTVQVNPSIYDNFATITYSARASIMDATPSIIYQTSLMITGETASGVMVVDDKGTTINYGYVKSINTLTVNLSNVDKGTVIVRTENVKLV